MMKSLTAKWLSLLLMGILFLNSACENDDDEPAPANDITAEKLEDWLTEAMNATPNVPGMMALVDIPGTIDWSSAQGLSQYDGEPPMRTDHQFGTASLSKTMTASIILQLQEEGQLELDAPLANWLNVEVLNELTLVDGTAYGSSLSIRHLLNHTSGIFDYLNNGSVHLDGFTNNPDRRYSLEDRIDIALSVGSAYAPPGSGFYYSNTNYILLGLLIETITEQDIATVFQERIFGPLNMNDSYLKPEAEQIDNLCHGYYQDFDVTSFSANFNYGNPAGGVISTVEDIRRFMRALSSRGLFSSSTSLSTMKEFGNYGYGLGLLQFLNNDTNGLVWGHDGADPGYYCFMVYVERHDAVLVFAGNRAEIEVDDTSYFLNKVVEALAE